MNWLKLIKNKSVIPVWIALGIIALGFIMAYRPWGMKVGLIIIGLLLILKGIYTKEKNKEDLASITPLGDSPLGCVIGLIVSLLFAVFLRFMPIWFVRTLWFLLGIGLILLSFKLIFNF
ncbi:MAG: hypothetical protein Q8934_20840 [Bacillota bacterium]|nr:hypothetical protein [Bacillota bacterium]